MYAQKGSPKVISSSAFIALRRGGRSTTWTPPPRTAGKSTLDPRFRSTLMYTRQADSEKSEARKEARKGTLRPNVFASGTPMMEETNDACPPTGLQGFSYNFAGESGGTHGFAKDESYGDGDGTALILEYDRLLYHTDR
jgi:hypothetical protein